MNKQNYQRVLDQIEQHPDTWDQSQWHCGSTHCFAGWAQLLSGKTSNDKTTRRDARIYLDMSFCEADYFFSPHRTISELRTGYDGDGCDGDGYDRYGYDRDGLDEHNRPQEA